MKKSKITVSSSQIINGLALYFSLSFLIAAVFAAFYTGEIGAVFRGWYLILVTPSPLVTDYFAIGGLSSALLNAGACGLACFVFMVCLKGDSHVNTLAGFFLVIAHCFYGLNFFNMWPCFLAPILFLRRRKLDLKLIFTSACFPPALLPLSASSYSAIPVTGNTCSGNRRLRSSAFWSLSFFPFSSALWFRSSCRSKVLAQGLQSVQRRPGFWPVRLLFIQFPL